MIAKINLHCLLKSDNETKSKAIKYYPFTISLDKCSRSCNFFDDSSTKAYVPNKTKDTNAKVFNMARKMNEKEAMVKHFLCDCKCKFDGEKCNSNQKWNNDKCLCECKKHHGCKKE